MKRLLDLYCRVGGASEGYKRAGFTPGGVEAVREEEREQGMKVYGGQSFRSEARPEPNGSRQTREIVAANSVAEVLRITGLTRYMFNTSWSETWNETELRVALADPGVVFWTELSGSFRGDAHWRADKH
jgi:hypothetical protein